MTLEKPYFMERQEWYYFDEKEFCYKLTEKAPKEAIESYNKFYETYSDVCIKKINLKHVK